jgi:hypothetical protein
MLEPSSQLFSHIAPAFEEAVESGDVLFFPSTVQEHQDGQVQVHVLFFGYEILDDIHQTLLFAVRNSPVSSART